jgi:hypothetical protein
VILIEIRRYLGIGTISIYLMSWVVITVNRGVSKNLFAFWNKLKIIIKNHCIQTLKLPHTHSCYNKLAKASW